MSSVARFDTEESAQAVMAKYHGQIVPGQKHGVPLLIKPWRPEFRADRAVKSLAEVELGEGRGRRNMMWEGMDKPLTIFSLFSYFGKNS